MNKVVERAQSYYSSGWNFYGRPDQITPFSLAEAGFVCIGGDRVQCHECKGILTNWSKDDVPMKEHRRHFPTCAFVNDWDKKILKTHECVELAMNIGKSFDLIYYVIQKDPSILEKPPFVMVKECEKEETKREAAENSAERKRVQQEAGVEDKKWEALRIKYCQIDEEDL